MGRSARPVERSQCGVSSLGLFSAAHHGRATRRSRNKRQRIRPCSIRARRARATRTESTSSTCDRRSGPGQSAESTKQSAPLAAQSYTSSCRCGSLAPVHWLVAGKYRGPVPADGSTPSEWHRNYRAQFVAPDDNPEFLKTLEEDNKKDEALLKDWEADLRRREEALRRQEQEKQDGKTDQKPDGEE